MLADLQPTLLGALVELHPLRASDFHDLYAVAADPLIWEQHPAHDRYQEPVFREFFRVAMESGGAFLVRDHSTGMVIGSSRYADYDPDTAVVEIGWTFLARSHWGGRYNGEMKQLMLDYAFTFVRSVLFKIGPNNIRSRTAVERIGGVFAGAGHNADGSERVVYCITREAWQARR